MCDGYSVCKVGFLSRSRSLSLLVQDSKGRMDELMDAWMIFYFSFLSLMTSLIPIYTNCCICIYKKQGGLTGLLGLAWPSLALCTAFLFSFSLAANM